MLQQASTWKDNLFSIWLARFRYDQFSFHHPHGVFTDPRRKMEAIEMAKPTDVSY
jgi:hypothetical protein